MKTFICPLISAAVVIALSGCATGPQAPGYTNQNQPGPVLGRAVGAGAGFAVGNVVGSAAGFGEGFAGGVHSSFDGAQRVIRYWREERTPDGRTILVPEEYIVDGNGRVISRLQ